MKKRIWRKMACFSAAILLSVSSIVGSEKGIPVYAEEETTTVTDVVEQTKEKWKQDLRAELLKRAVTLSEEALTLVAEKAQSSNMTPEETAAVVAAQKQEILSNTEKLVDAVSEAAKDKVSQNIEDTTAELQTHIPPENAVTNFRVSSATLDSLTLQWTKSANTATYIVAYWKSGDTSSTQEVNVGNVETYTLNNLEHCKYKIAVYSANYRSDNTLTSNNPSVSIEAAPLPDVPKKVKVNNARAGYCSLRLKGLDPNNTNIYQSEAILYDSSDQKLGVFTGNDTGISISSNKLKADAFYHVKVRGYFQDSDNTKLYGDWTDFYYFGTKLSTISAWQQKQVVTLVWKPVTGADGYTVYISKKLNSGYKKVKVTTEQKVVVKKYGKKKLKAGNTYYFKVQAFTIKEGSANAADSKAKRVSISY